MYDLVVSYLCELEELQDPKEIAKIAKNILEIEYALKLEGDTLATMLILEVTKWISKKWVLSKKNPISAEARNLYNPETGKAYSRKDNVADLSQLNPLPNSTFWKPKEDISNVDIENAFYNGGHPLHEGIKINFPLKKAYFKKIRRTQTRPKIDIYTYNENGKKSKFKLKFGKEIHADPTVSSLAVALGFSSDVTKYVRDFKLVLGKTTVEQVKVDWQAYYHGGFFRLYDINDYIKETGSDEEGNYIIFTEAVIEGKPKGLIRLGPWAFTGNGHQNLREVRGMMLFNIWIGNSDAVESRNNKVIMRKFGDEYKMYHLQHDMGFALGGNMQPEMPGHFPWHMIKGIDSWTFEKSKSMEFVFRVLRENNLYNKITYADAKWMSRLIAQFTRKQIEDAMALGGWPEAIGKLLVEKLISRRNDLVKAFGLEGEVVSSGKTIEKISINKNLTTADGVVVEGKLKKTTIPGYTQDFGHYIQQAFQPFTSYLNKLIIKETQGVIGVVNRITVDPVDIGADRGLIAQVIVNISRDVERNPHPTSDDDMFLVKDHYELGFRLGYGLVLSGEAAYVKRFTLVYPVRTEAAGLLHQNTLIDIFLPFRVFAKKLPEKYFLIREDYLETRGRVRFPMDTLIGTEGTFSRVLLGRSFATNRYEDSMLVYNDTTVYSELAFRVFMELGIVKLPFARASEEFGGRINGTLYLVPNEDISQDQVLSMGIGRAIVKGDYIELEDYIREISIHDMFEASSYKFTLLGLLKYERRTRTDEIRIVDKDVLHGTVRERYLFQHKYYKKRSWRFFDNGETHSVNIDTFHGVAPEEGQDLGRVVHLSYFVNDKNTKNKELEEGYLKFINGISGEPGRLIEFSPSYHTINKLWGNLDYYVDVYYYEKAISEMLKITRSEFEDELDEVLKTSPLSFWRRAALLNGESVVNKYASFFRRMKKAAKENKISKKLKLFVKALERLVYKNGMTFEHRIMATINRILRRKLGYNDYYISALITPSGARENNLLDGKDLYGDAGSYINPNNQYIMLAPVGPADYYSMFDWIFD